MSSAVSGLSHAVKGGKQNTADVRTQIFGETKQKMQRTSPYEVQYSKVDDITVSDERPKVLRVSRACITCRKRKTKCDNSMPCRTCSQIGAECIYEQPQKRGPKTAPKNVNYVRHLSSSGNSSMYSVTFKSNFGLDHDIASTRLSGSMPDAVYWEAIREMPPQETTQPLFSFFFENLWEFLPIIDQITLEEFRRTAQPPKKVLLLLYSLLALSSLIAERVGKSSKHSTELFHNQAKCLFSSLCEQWPASLEMVQASLLISVFNSENLPSSWMTSGIALRMARALDLPQDSNIRNGDLTWMGCQIFDRFIAGCYGRLAATHDSDYDLDFHQANIYNADRQKMLHFYDLFAIYGRIIHIANSPRRRVEIYQQLPDLQSVLSKWLQNYVRSSTTTDQFHLFLLTTYHHAAIVLFQTAIIPTHSVPHSAEQKYIEALLWSVNELITLYESQTEKLRLIPFSPVHWIQMTVSSLHSITKLEWSRSTEIFNLISRLKRILEILPTFGPTTDNQQTRFNYSKLQTLSIRSNHYKLPPVGPRNYTATSGQGHSLPPISTISNVPRLGVDSVSSQPTPQIEPPPMRWNKPYPKNSETWDSSTDYADRSEIMGRNTSHHHRMYGDRLDSSYLAHFPRAREQEITHGI